MRFTIRVVPGWLLDENQQLGIAFNSPDKRAILKIVSVASNYALDDLADLRISQAQNEASGYLAKSELISEERVTLPQRREAVRLVYQWKDFPDNAAFCDTHFVEYIVSAGGWAYWLLGSMCVQDMSAFLVDLETMQQSFITSR